METAEDEARLIELLPSVHGRVVAKDEQQKSLADEDQEAKKQRALAALQRLAARGGASSFGDASEWQREIRSWDRVLDGREE
ncbi:hypothetical protein J2I47_18855 [Fibrella sp. HMF5335]|uniref:Uncharacterized protein n=1 Tax=Fibrella rubiginis TaxID=2817060 RepID=A0A939K4P1_9BACT|nr:hypothetical protein [Fibrella rubiginis]MBO0938619.1 hypothetical protein [Fibrella rubiginis]